MTQKSLKDLVPDIARYVQENKGRVEYANRLNLVDAGQLLNEIEESLLKEGFKPETVHEMKYRMPCINLLTRIVDKLARIYDEPISRSSTKDRDNEIIEFYESEMDLDGKLGWANRMYNLHDSCAIEPYLNLEGKPRLRILSPDQFLMWTDDPTDPTNPTVFIKFMGDVERIKDEENVDRDGRYQKPSEESRIGLLYVYSANEFLVMDEGGQIRDDKNPALNLNGKNPLGTLPAIYVNKSQSKLLPIPNEDMLNNTVLVPKLLGDLNYAVKYLSHSLVVVKDMDVPEEIDRNPGAVWDFKSVGEGDEPGKGTVEVITPKIDIDAVIRLVQTTVATWLESLGVRPGTMGHSTGSSRTSALAKIVDEADATAVRTGQVNVFSRVEERLFDLIGKAHEVWMTKPTFPMKKKLSKDAEIASAFPEQKIMSSEQEKMENANMLITMGLATRKQALRLIYPTMTEAELDAWVKELDQDVNQQLQSEDGESQKPSDEPKDNEASGKEDNKSNQE